MSIYEHKKLEETLGKRSFKNDESLEIVEHNKEDLEGNLEELKKRGNETRDHGSRWFYISLHILFKLVLHELIIIAYSL